jgi:FkbM family methyltransferase
MPSHIKDALRSATEAIGLEVYRTNVYTSQKLRYHRLFSQHHLDLVLDVGANAGQFSKLCRSVGYQGHILSFEPSSNAHQRLLRASSADPNWTVADRMALGPSTGEIEINIAANSFSSSVLPMLDSHLSADPDSSYLNKEKVPVRRLDDVLPSTAAHNRIFLKLDVQGFELQVLGGAPKTLSHAVAVQLELSLIPLYQGETLMPEMYATMAGHGFSLWDMEPNFRNPSTGRLLQVDALFVREAALQTGT